MSLPTLILFMDIPPHHLGQTQDAVTSKIDQHHVSAPVPLEQLKLIPGKNYHPIVSGLAENLDKTNTEPSTSAKGRPLITLTEWLLKLNGKSILISTEIPLKVGQSLTVKLSPEQTLLIQPTIPSTSKPAPPLQGAKLNSEAIAVLLKAINQVMPRQITLEKGLAELNILANKNNANIASIQAKTILSVLTQDLPKAHQLLTQANADEAKTRQASESSVFIKNSSQSSDKVLQNNPEKQVNTSTSVRIEPLISAIKNSGLFFEKTLTQGPPKSNILTTEINQLQKTLNTPAQAHKLYIPNVPESSNTKLRSQLSGASQANLSQTLNIPNDVKAPLSTNNLRARIQNLLGTSKPKTDFGQMTIEPYKAVTHKVGNAQTLSTANIKETYQPDIGKDLKEHLFKAISALSPLVRANEDPDKSFAKSYVEAFTQVDLLKTPFNFPHLNQDNILKANAILADQELSTGQLLKLIAGMLNRIQFNQLNSLYQSQSSSNETVTVQSWFFELPVVAPHQLINIFNLRIDQESNKHDQEGQDLSKKQPLWRIALSFNLGSLGAIYVQANLSPPTISSTIWAEQQQTLKLIKREMPYFKQRLSQIGLEVGDICCQKGQPKQDKATLEQSLVDIKA